MKQQLKNVHNKNLDLRDKQNNIRQTNPVSSQKIPILSTQGVIGNHGVLQYVGRGIIQPKLIINSPNDRYEQEADRVADEVIRMDKPNKTNKYTRLLPPLNEPSLDVHQLKVDFSSDSEMPTKLESSIQSQKNNGQVLPDYVRNYFEPRFGYDFGKVRVFSNPTAFHNARALNANAFTVGNNIFFGRGQYKPGINSGKKLIAHELAHVVQQNGNRVQHTLNIGQTIVRRSGPEVIVPPPLKNLTIYEIVMDIMETIKGFPDNFLGALKNWIIVVTQKSKEEATPKEVGLIVIEEIGKFALDKAVDYVSSIVPGGKVAKALTSLVKSIGTAIENEKNRVEAATESNILKSFFVSLNTHFTTLHSSINAAKGNDAAAAREKYNHLHSEDEKRKYRERLVINNYMITNDLKTIYSVDALFQNISELWIRKTKMPGEKVYAQVRISLNEDWKVTDAYIDAPRGSRIAEQLLSGGEGKFDLSRFRVPRLIRWFPVPGEGSGLTRCWVHVSADGKFSGWGATLLGRPFLKKFLQLVTSKPIPQTVKLSGHKTK